MNDMLVQWQKSMPLLPLIAAFVAYQVSLVLFPDVSAILVLLPAIFVAAIIFRFIDPLGVSSVLVAVAALWGTASLSSSPWLSILSFCVAAGLATAAAADILPGFSHHLVFKDRVLTPGATPFTLRIEGSKIVFSSLVLSFSRNEYQMLRDDLTNLPAISVGLLGITSLLIVGMLAGGIRWEPKKISFPGMWVFANLACTSLSEEIVFRFFLQGGLSRLIGIQHAGVTSLVIASVIFGLCHFRGGGLLIVFSFIAGICYGSIFILSESVLLCALVHFLLNTIHLYFFTYPRIAPPGRNVHGLDR